MSHPRFRWWQYAIKMVQDFLVLDVAAVLSADDQRDHDAVAEAIRATRQMEQGEHRMLLVREIYWAGSKCTLEEAAARLSVAEAVAEQWHGDFIREVGRCWGFDISPPPKKRGRKPKKAAPDS